MRKHELHPRTEALNRTQKNQSKRARTEAIAWLAHKFPEAFNNKETIRPLKQGIMDDILVYAEEALVEGISKSKLREAVVIFTRRLDYLACVKAREMRINLMGVPVAEVTEEEALNAASKIRKRVEKSLKNTKKSGVSVPSKQTSVYPASHHLPTVEPTPYYSADRADLSPLSGLAGQSPKQAAVVIKHKASRQIDQDALARFKEKLGLAQPNT